MLTEIREQPEALSRTIPKLRAQSLSIQNVAGDCKRIVLFARGSSDNAAAYGLYTFPALTGRLATLGTPSIATNYRTQIDLTGTLVIVISQSGQTQEIIETAQWAKSQGARVIGITNFDDSPLATVADEVLVTDAGPERAVPATKTFITQLLAVVSICAAMGDTEGIWAAIEQLPQITADSLTYHSACSQIGSELAKFSSCIVTSRGFATTVALEIALKLQEAALLPALGLSRADLVHGPAALLGPNCPALIFAAPTDLSTSQELEKIAERCRAQEAQVFTVGGRNREMWPSSADGTPAWLCPFPLVVLGQQIAESVALQRGLDPDAPRHLTKVTQT
jgi:glucosamine--fructose-6-phosphate aminotransferase (isomerizing)